MSSMINIQSQNKRGGSGTSSVSILRAENCEVWQQEISGIGGIAELKK